MKNISWKHWLQIMTLTTRLKCKCWNRSVAVLYRRVKSISVISVTDRRQPAVIRIHWCMFYRWLWCCLTNQPWRDDRDVQMAIPKWLTEPQHEFGFRNINRQTSKYSHKINERKKSAFTILLFVNTFIMWMSLFSQVQNSHCRKKLFLTRWKIE